MGSNKKFIKGFNGKDIFLRTWNEVKNPKGVIQIIHGMIEHSGRYEDFARFLNANGYIVYADDHRGHGETALKHSEYGYLGENGFNHIVEDEFIITKLIKATYPNLPVYILGHSFGSFISQKYITKYSLHIDGVILSGSSKREGIDLKAGFILLNIQKVLFNRKKEAKLINKLTFLNYTKKIAAPKTSSDWLTADEAIVDKYIKDSHCQFVPTIDFYCTFFHNLLNLYKADNLKTLRKDLPIFIISGDKDPVGNYGKGTSNLHSFYNELGMQNVTLKLYENGRHEILNEINRKDVYNDIYNFLCLKS
ncbi:alpha/beta hydrolase [uncultured Clostridium sp.]|uniref:alpha/beta hydrolase n=1 Tax=uncultured Clostridium sp. TaxID=59620 RepID=UPI00261608C4|nr:alpha/beta hydrolase [uncultured Clostridium sp.]